MNYYRYLDHEICEFVLFSGAHDVENLLLCIHSSLVYSARSVPMYISWNKLCDVVMPLLL